MQSLFQIEIIYKPAKDETIVFSRSAPAIVGERHATPGTVAAIRTGRR